MSAIEKNHVFSDGQSIIIAAAAAAQATNICKLVAGKDFLANTKYADLSVLGKMRVIAQAKTPITAVADSATLTIAVWNHTAATSIESGTLLASVDVTVPLAGLAAGTNLADLMIPQNKITKQFVGVRYSVATQNVDAGTVDTYLSDHRERRSGPTT
jgi:hypothetical protein